MKATDIGLGCYKECKSIGGESDTIACIAGGIAEAYYKDIPQYIAKRAKELLSEEMREILDMYYAVLSKKI